MILMVLLDGFSVFFDAIAPIHWRPAWKCLCLRVGPKILSRIAFGSECSLQSGGSVVLLIYTLSVYAVYVDGFTLVVATGGPFVRSTSAAVDID